LKKQDRRVFSTLNGLRGLAALAVVTLHVPDHTFRELLPGSPLAVDLFFVLSGFVLAHSYTERLRDEMGAMEFMRIRIIRLYPLYILGTALVMAHFALLAGFNYRAWLHVIGSAVFAVLFLPTPPGISPDWHPFPLNFPAWSLFFELVINYVFALLLPRLTNRLLAGVILIGLPMLIATGLYFGDLTPGWSFSNFWGGGGRVVYSFFAGVAAYRVWRRGNFDWIKIAGAGGADHSGGRVRRRTDQRPRDLRSICGNHRLSDPGSRRSEKRASGLFHKDLRAPRACVLRHLCHAGFGDRVEQNDIEAIIGLSAYRPRGSGDDCGFGGPYGLGVVSGQVL
jgi:Acyltransferase family